MNKSILIIILIFISTASKAQTNCSVHHGEAYVNTVLPGVNASVIDINNKVQTNIISSDKNLSVYFFSNCIHKVRIIKSMIGNRKIKLEFIRIKDNKDEAGTDEKGDLKIIKAKQGLFLWKANAAFENGNSENLKEKVFISGYIGKKKLTMYLSPIKLQPASLY